MTSVSPHETYEFDQPADVVKPTAINFYNSVGLYDTEGLPLFARDEEEFKPAGGLRLAAYNRGDSPSRDNSDLPYNATWFEHLRENYADGLRLLEGLRHAYADHLTGNGELDSEAVLDVYHMGVNMPQFLLWRQGSSVRNGEIPPAATVLRQALLGIGIVILHQDEQTDITDLTGRDVASIAERNGDLLGDQPFPGVPKMLCPASPDMIAGLSEALLRGNAKRGTGNFLETYNIDIRKLRDFSRFTSQYVRKEEELVATIGRLIEEEPAHGGSGLIKPKTKVERFDEIIVGYGKFLDEAHPKIFETLDRTDAPPPMTLRRIYIARTDLVRARIEALMTDDPANITRAVLMNFESILPKELRGMFAKITG